MALERGSLRRHAVLGAGGVGGLIGGLLAAGGFDVTLVVRAATLHDYPSMLTVLRANETIEGPVRVVDSLSPRDAVDVLWVTVKATQLDDALASVAGTGFAAVVPLLNGVDHIASLNARFGRDSVIPATIAVEAERMAPGVVRQGSPFVTLQIAERGRVLLEPALAALGARAVTVGFEPNETTLMWAKLAFLAPFALTTTAADADIGFIRSDPEWRQRFERAAAEAARAAEAEGATIDAARASQVMDNALPAMRSSMWRDVAAGNPPELDAIGGAVTRAAERHGIDVPVTRDLIERVRRRSAP